MSKYNDDLFSLFDDFFNSSRKPSFGIFKINFTEDESFPKDNDSNFNKTTEEIETDTHVVVKETWKSVDGTQIYSRTTSKSKLKASNKSIETLKSDLKLAIESENCEKAAEIRDQIRKIESSK